MRKHLYTAGLALGFLGLAVMAKADFLFWLDGASRNNAKDPKSAMYVKPTNTPAQSTFNTPAMTPTISPTMTQTQANHTSTVTQTVTQTVSNDTPTVTQTVSNDTPTVTQTPTQTTLTYVLYSDAQVMRGEYAVPTPAVTLTQVTGGGPSADPTTYASIVCTGGTGYSVAQVVNFGYSGSNAVTTDVSGKQSLELWARMPSSCNTYAFEPGIRLVTPNGAGDAKSKKLALANYIVGAPSSEFPTATWVQVRIPLSAFLGDNGETGANNFNFTVLTSVSGVSIEPLAKAFDKNGDFNGSLDVDDILFSDTAGAAPSTYYNELANFNLQGFVNSWGGNFYWYSDRCSGGDCNTPNFACANASTISFPATIGVTGANVYTSATAAIDNTEGTTASPCHAARLAGYMGDPTACSNNYPAAGIGMDFNAAKTAYDLSGYTGITFAFKTGAGSDPTQAYKVVIETQSAVDCMNNTANGGAGQGFFATITAPTTSWQTYTLTWAQFAPPSWASCTKCKTLDPREIVSVKFEPTVNGKNYDFLIDDIALTGTSTPGAPSVQSSAACTPVPWTGVVYDGDTTSLSTNFYVGTKGAQGMTEQTGAAHGGTKYAELTMTAESYAGLGCLNFGFDSGSVPQTHDVTAAGYTALSISLKVPAATGGCFFPGISLVTYDGTNKYNSRAVTFTTYVSGGTSYMPEDTWVTAVIPLSAFLGANYGDGTADSPIHTWTSADLNKIMGVVVQPYYGSYTTASPNSFSGAIQIDDVKFTTDTVNQNENITRLIADFETPDGSSRWGTYWSAVCDSVTSATCAVTKFSSISYPPSGTTSPVYATGVTWGTKCNSGRLAGYKGAYNGPWGTPVCGSNDYPYLNMALRLNKVPAYDPANNTINNIGVIDVSNNNTLKDLPASGATGLKIAVKLGPNHQTGQAYKIYFNLKGPTAAEQAWDGSEFYVIVAGDKVNSSTWTELVLPFPADASLPSPHGNVDGNNGVSTSDLTWAQDQYANTANVPWNRAYICQLGVGALERGMDADIMIDDVELY